MKANVETTVLKSLSASIAYKLEREVERCELDEKHQSKELSSEVFGARAKSRYISILLKEIEEIQKGQLFSIETLAYKSGL
jgi:hypothetical protein